MKAGLLVVESEPRIRETLARFLDSFGGRYAITAVASGDEAMAELTSNAGIQIMLTDIHGPEADRLELVRWCAHHAPEVQIVAMAENGAGETRDLVLKNGAVRLINKPVDLTDLESTISRLLRSPAVGREPVSGFALVDIVQFFSRAGGDRFFVFSKNGNQGAVAFVDGSLVHCSVEGIYGPDAFFEMTLWGEGEYVEIADIDLSQYPQNISANTADLVAEANRLRTELDGEFTKKSSRKRKKTADEIVQDLAMGCQADAKASNSANRNRSDHQPQNEEEAVAINEHLQDFQTIEGFKGIAVFTAQGEMIDSIAAPGIDVKSIGMFANNALLNAQKATDQMGVGRGNLMQIRAPKAVILMRCLNEATDFAATKEGKAHFHTVVIMDPEGNSGMATMMLDRASEKVAEELR